MADPNPEVANTASVVFRGTRLPQHQEKPESAPIRFQALGWYKIAWNPTVPFEGLTIASIVDSQR